MLTKNAVNEGEVDGLGALLFFLGLISLGEETTREDIFLFSAVARAELSGAGVCFGLLKPFEG